MIFSRLKCLFKGHSWKYMGGQWEEFVCVKCYKSIDNFLLGWFGNRKLYSTLMLKKRLGHL